MRNFKQGRLLEFWWVPLAIVSIFLLGRTYFQNRNLLKLQLKVVKKTQKINLKVSRNFHKLEKKVSLEMDFPKNAFFCNHDYKDAFILFFDKEKYFLGHIPGNRGVQLSLTADKYIFESGSYDQKKNVITLKSKKNSIEIEKKLRFFKLGTVTKKPRHLSLYGEILSGSTCWPSEYRLAREYLKHFAYSN